MPREKKYEEMRKWIRSYKTYILNIPIKGQRCDYSVVAYDFAEAKKVVKMSYPYLPEDEIKYINSYTNL